MTAEVCSIPMFGTFAEAQFAIERTLAKVGVPLDPRSLRIGVGDDKYATIVHPIKHDSFAVAQFRLPAAVHPADFDAAAYVAQFKSKSAAAH